MIEYSEEALDDLRDIRTRDGMESMLTLFEWCKKLPEPGTRLEAERLGGPRNLFRLRVGDYHIVFQLVELRRGDIVRVLRVRQRKSPS